MTASTKSFPTVDVLTIVVDRTLSRRCIGGVYLVLNWMTGENLLTHQLPRVCREATPVLIAAHPALAQAREEAEQVTSDNWREWRDIWIARYGATISVPKFAADAHERIDPLSELAERVHPDRIIVIEK